MERRVAVVATLVVAVTLAAVPTGGLAQSGSASVAPGERFAGVVGVQGAEVQGEVESRAFEARFQRAGSNASQAAVIADQTERNRERLQELQERKERLREARENGSISEGQFRARMARVVAESNALQQQFNRTAEASAEVPDAALRERGVDPDELERLRAAAGNLTGPEVAAIARNITGDPAGPPPGVGPSEERPGSSRGQSADAGNRSDGGDGAGASGQRADDGSGNGPPGNADGSADGRSGNRSTGSGPPDGSQAGERGGDGSGRDDGGS